MSEPLLKPAEYGPEIRYKSCLVLENIGIPYVIWFEDALVHYGVPTVVFDLYVLVLDIDTAADALIKAGWIVDTQNPHRIGDSVVAIPQTPLISPDQKTKTVLLLASDWRFPLAANPALERVPVNDRSPSKLSFPLLSGLLDSLIESWLVGPTEDATLLVRLACYFNYLYGYVPALKERSFADQMKYEHRQFHFDVLAGMASPTFPFRNHQRGIRDALLQDRYELQECSASRDDEALFVRIAWALEERNLLPRSHLGGRRGISVDHLIQLLLDQIFESWGKGRKVSIPQGSPISPILFLLFNTTLIRALLIDGIEALRIHPPLLEGGKTVSYGWIDDAATLAISDSYAVNQRLLESAGQGRGMVKAAFAQIRPR
ncbi:uncharacterized protein KD926_003119 [Aspergillus affinis]|uniref:uncharacterized protein n=1 Tax=Aspergillus affinis TaxID=1070780 RepID=UPI0022FF1E2A|nr:uncharacterized protein KD926_003119 [Aspergillus affinis]KAI9035675.1 hypothetical protein KD926_003119 [Aspergillus affinis]